MAKQRLGFHEGRPRKFDDVQIQNALELLECNSYNRVAKLTGISKSSLLRAKRNNNKSNK